MTFHADGLLLKTPAAFSAAQGARGKWGLERSPQRGAWLRPRLGSGRDGELFHGLERVQATFHGWAESAIPHQHLSDFADLQYGSSQGSMFMAK